MNLVLAVTVDVIPVAQPRQRFAVVAGRPHNYVPSTHPVRTYQAVLRLAVQQEMRRLGLGAPLEGPLILGVRFYLPRPQRLNTRRWPVGPLPHRGKPDFSNLLKSTEDALVGLLWRDDAQIFALAPWTGKVYCERDGRPRVELEVYTVEEGECPWAGAGAQP